MTDRIPWDELRLSRVEVVAVECPDACSVDVESLIAEVRLHADRMARKSEAEGEYD
jgi:hypothetical protein